jgi:hypothetical protein
VVAKKVIFEKWEQILLQKRVKSLKAHQKMFGVKNVTKQILRKNINNKIRQRKKFMEKIVYVNLFSCKKFSMQVFFVLGKKGKKFPKIGFKKSTISKTFL